MDCFHLLAIVGVVIKMGIQITCLFSSKHVFLECMDLCVENLRRIAPINTIYNMINVTRGKGTSILY